MSDYMPTTDEVREGYSSAASAVVRAELRAEFDRWYAAEIRKAKKVAWSEGCGAGLDTGLTVGEICLGIKPPPIPPAPNNPYEEETDDE